MRQRSRPLREAGHLAFRSVRRSGCVRFGLARRSKICCCVRRMSTIAARTERRRPPPFAVCETAKTLSRCLPDIDGLIGKIQPLRRPLSARCFRRRSQLAAGNYVVVRTQGLFDRERDLPNDRSPGGVRASVRIRSFSIRTAHTREGLNCAGCAGSPEKTNISSKLAALVCRTLCRTDARIN